MQDTQSNEQSIGFHAAVQIFKKDRAAWERVRERDGEIEATTFVNGAQFIVRRADGVRSYAIKAADSARCQEVVQAIQQGQIDKLLKCDTASKMN